MINDETWFVGKDVADALGYERADNAIRKHVEQGDKLMHRISASGQTRVFTVINESGLYSLILGSKLESAKKFKHWVTSEVLPSIRKHGSLIDTCRALRVIYKKRRLIPWDCLIKSLSTRH
ncbi:Bro-N domain-containing protein [Blautia schinkii]|nr:Bro-N domain-containing protein [Blautia schinkii]